MFFREKSAPSGAQEGLYVVSFEKFFAIHSIKGVYIHALVLHRALNHQSIDQREKQPGELLSVGTRRAL
jgi:hypothetical protein